jgi:hypothetical protein
LAVLNYSTTRRDEETEKEKQQHKRKK